jgi:hypothetical protein
LATASDFDVRGGDREERRNSDGRKRFHHPQRDQLLRKPAPSLAAVEVEVQKVFLIEVNPVTTMTISVIGGRAQDLRLPRVEKTSKGKDVAAVVTK